MAKKNFDDFVMAAGKRKKPSAEEVDELSRVLHPIKKVEVEAPAPSQPEKPARPAKKVVAQQKAMPETAKIATSKTARKLVGKEKVRITVDLEKDLYRKLKMQVIVEETDLSTYLRDLLQKNLPK